MTLLSFSVLYLYLLTAPLRTASALILPISESAQPVSVSTAKRQPMLRVAGVGGQGVSYHWISQGKAGSYQTAALMAKLVREAAVKDLGLERFASAIITRSGLDSHSDPDDVIDALFRYVQKISYISDTTGAGSFDAVATARETIEKGYGDCDDLSVLLATLLALVGFRPGFVLARMHESSRGFDHVYVEVNSTKGRVALDPTTRKNGMGWESPKVIEKVSYPIFGRGAGGSANGLRDINPAILTGVQVGVGMIPVVGPILAPFVSVLGKLFGGGKSPQAIAAGKSFDQLDKQLAAFLLELNHKADAGTLTADDYNAAQNGVAALQQAAAAQMQQDNTGYVRSQLASEMPRYNTWLQSLAAKVISPAAAQAIAAGTVTGTSPSTTPGGGVQSAGNDITATLSSVSNSLPVLLIGGLALFFLMKRR